MTTKINIKGPIVDDQNGKFMEFWGMDDVYTYPAKINKALADANGEDVDLIINSPGGYVSAGSEIYTDLQQYPGKVEAHIYGDADSAASFIAMAADKVLMAPMAKIMIHRASGANEGNADVMHSTGGALDQIDQSLVNIFAKKTGKDKQDIFNMLNAETWMNAETAIKEGFADGMLVPAPTSIAEPAMNAALPIPHLSNEMMNKFTDFLQFEREKTDDVDKPIQDDTDNKKDESQRKLALLFGGK